MRVWYARISRNEIRYRRVDESKLVRAARAARGHRIRRQVDVFSPQGEVKGVRQIAVRFSEPMVAFGDPRLPEPFEIDCPAPGTARWADQKNW